MKSMIPHKLLGPSRNFVHICLLDLQLVRLSGICKNTADQLIGQEGGNNMGLFGSPSIEKLRAQGNIKKLIKALGHNKLAIRKEAAQALDTRPKTGRRGS
jgi:hypothetical protein